MCSASQPPRLFRLLCEPPPRFASGFCKRLKTFQQVSHRTPGNGLFCFAGGAAEAGDSDGAASLRDGRVAALMCGRLCEYVSSHFYVSADGRVGVKVNEGLLLCQQPGMKVKLKTWSDTWSPGREGRGENGRRQQMAGEEESK